MLLMAACVITFSLWRDIKNGYFDSLYLLIGLVVLGVSLMAIFFMKLTKKLALPKGSEQQPAPANGEVKDGIHITLWAQDEATATQLGTDPYFLLGALIGDSSSATKTFLEALDKGGALSYKVTHNSTKGGFDVELTVTS